MRWILSLEKIILYFYMLLLLGTFILIDYYIFSILLEHYNIYLLLIVIALISSVGALFSLNSAVRIFKIIEYHAHKGKFLYKEFSEFIIIIVVGTLIIIPELITSVIGIFLYIRPIRNIVAHVLYKTKKNTIIFLFSHFLADSISSSEKE